jgi:hypothetical protein
MMLNFCGPALSVPFQSPLIFCALHVIVMKVRIRENKNLILMIFLLLLLNDANIRKYFGF